MPSEVPSEFNGPGEFDLWQNLDRAFTRFSGEDPIKFLEQQQRFIVIVEKLLSKLK